MHGFWRRQGTDQVGCRVVLGSSRGNGIAKDEGCCRACAVRRLDCPSRFNFAQRREQQWRGDVLNRDVADEWPKILFKHPAFTYHGARA